MEPPLKGRIFSPPTPPVPPGVNELGRRLGAGRGAESRLAPGCSQPE